MGSIIGHRIYYNGVGRGSERPVAQTQQNLTQVSPLLAFFEIVDSLQGACAMISTSLPHCKSGPKTLGIPAWAKAAQRRRRSVMRLDKPKTMDQIHAEFRVANDPTELNIYTTTRQGSLMSDSSRESLVEKLVYLSMKMLTLCFKCWYLYILDSLVGLGRLFFCTESLCSNFGQTCTLGSITM